MTFICFLYFFVNIKIGFFFSRLNIKISYMNKSFFWYMCTNKNIVMRAMKGNEEQGRLSEVLEDFQVCLLPLTVDE